MKPVLIGNSQNTRKVKELVEHVADTGLNTVVTGETGVGKELVAQYLYEKSPRKGKPFVKVNCAALPDGLMESELFGHERGAFTGADRKMRGKFELSHNGVLFMDEIGDMSFPLQSKLLHALQNQEFSPLGSEKKIKTNSWIIAATNHDLADDIKEEKFREDLYYRINIININIEPLRKRRDDIPVLIDYFLDQYTIKFNNKKVSYPSDSVKQRLIEYDWPGNVRELQNVLQKAMILGRWEDIVNELQTGKTTIPGGKTTIPVLEIGQPQPENGKRVSWTFDLPDFDTANLDGFSLKKSAKEATSKVEKAIISQALKHTAWNRMKATKILKISYKTLLYKISDLGITPPDTPENA